MPEERHFDDLSGADLVELVCAEHGIDHNGLAALLGIARQTPWRWARGQSTPDRYARLLLYLLWKHGRTVGRRVRECLPRA